MKIYLNEKPAEIDAGMTLAELVASMKPDADVRIINGHPVAAPDILLQQDDRVTLIKRGEIPSFEDLEFLLTTRHTPLIHQQLKTKHVGIAGVGGLGSQVAIALARSGIGSLTLVDFDVVEPSNLNRQQYFIDQIGLPKVSALAENLRRINPYVKITAHCEKVSEMNLCQLFGTVDLLVEAFDDAGQKAQLCRSFLQHFPDRYLVAASGMAGYGTANRIATKRINRRFYLCGDDTSAARPGHGLMAPRVGVVAHHQANAALRLLLNLEPETDNDDPDN